MAEDLVSSYTVAIVPLEDLRPYKRNSRTHSAEQVAELAGLIREYGWTNPVLAEIDGDGMIVAGHGRILAAKQIYADGGVIRLPNGRPLPNGTVPAIDCAGWSDAQRRAYVIADNKSALNSGWDEKLLALEIGELQAEGFDLGLLAFSETEINSLLSLEAGDVAEEPKDTGALSRRFGVPPFTILSAREGWWQERKRAWLALGIQSELGRGEDVNAPDTSFKNQDKLAAFKKQKRKPNAVPGGAPMPLDRRKGA